MNKCPKDPTCKDWNPFDGGACTSELGCNLWNSPNCTYYCVDYSDKMDCPYWNNRERAKLADTISANYPITCKDAVCMLEAINWGKMQRMLEISRIKDSLEAQKEYNLMAEAQAKEKLLEMTEL